LIRDSRLAALRIQMASEGIEALLVSTPVNVAYLTGFSGTLGYVFVTAKSAYLLTDFRYLGVAREQAGGYEIVNVGPSVWKRVAELAADEGISALTVEGEHVTMAVYNKLLEEAPELAVTAETSPVNRLRKVKSMEEQDAIGAAVTLADEAFLHILGFLKPGVREREAALELEYFMRRRGASGVSFEIIVASGKRSALPHGVAGEKRLETGDAVVLDLGCILGHYCSDLSRTVFIGDVSVKQREIYQTVLDAQLTALQSIRAGMTGREADELARGVLAARGLAGHFGHGLGHGVGREIHEMPRLSPVSDEELVPGMVVTVEPGVYLDGEFGVRIEDVVVVEETGCRILTGSTKELLCL